MPPKVGGFTGNTGSGGNNNSNNPFLDDAQQQQQQQWVNVTWMPHSALSQTSHVCLTIHSAHVVLLNDDGTPLSSSSSICDDEMEWRIEMSIRGFGNVPLAPIATYTKAATVTRRTRDHLTPSSAVQSRRIITIQRATHECHWDYLAYMPLRWRDLTRDSHLYVEIIRSTTMDKENEDIVVYHTTIPFFSKYGKLVTGLQKLRLSRGPLTNPTNRNYGLIRDDTTKDVQSEIDNDDDPVWKSVLILDQLERMEADERGIQERNNINNSNHPHIINNNVTNSFGHVPSVPWLDAMMKERAIQEIHDAYCVDTAVCKERFDLCFSI
jgi:hypothetical protein